MTTDKYEPDPIGHVPLFKYFDRIMEEKFKALKGIMDEREKTSMIAASTLVTKESQEQLVKFVLKQEMEDKLDKIQAQLTGPLGFELRMRAVEQESHGANDRDKRISSLETRGGAISAQLYLVIIGLPIAVTTIVTIITYMIMAHIKG